MSMDEAGEQPSVFRDSIEDPYASDQFESLEQADIPAEIQRELIRVASDKGVSIDVLDFIADCVMASMARSGSVYELTLPADLLTLAFQNTVELLKREVVIEPDREERPVP